MAHASGDEAEAETQQPNSRGGLADGDDGYDDCDEEPEFMHRLCPNYASDINSPLRCGGLPSIKFKYGCQALTETDNRDPELNALIVHV